MKQNIKSQLLESIGSIYEQSHKCKLDPKFFDKENNHLKVVSDYFKTSNSQSLFVAVIFTLNFKGSSANVKELTNYFDCNPVKILEFSEDLECLNSKGILATQKRSFKSNLLTSRTGLEINEKIKTAILKNEPMPNVEQEKIKDVIQLLEKIYKTVGDSEFDSQELYEAVKELILANRHFPFIKRVHDLDLEMTDACLFIYLTWKTIVGYDSIDIESTLDDIIDDSTEQLQYINTLISNENALMKLGLTELIEAEQVSDARLKLSTKSVEMLQELEVKILNGKKKKDNIIEPISIPTKELFFNDSEHKQISTLRTLFQEQPFMEIQNRLQSKGMPKGVAVLLHGSPGTGKTETVFQIAKETNRSIMKVDISESKSMWFGESEKIIKRIFTDYKSYAKKCKQIPILLFNEADGIISKRKVDSTSNVAQTENAMQNILLEELERFEGIFMATTNLADNLDSAFERRFLFKVAYAKPSVMVKAKIWNSKLPMFSLEECERLADRFDFSGGQIDNIVRKAEIHEVVHGIIVDFSNIEEFCSVELLSNTSGKRIGFVQSKG